MELIFRQRLNRPDKAGRATIFGDLHWAGGNRSKLPTGVKVLPAHWRPDRTKRIATAATNAIGLNLRLTRFQEAVQGVFDKANTDKRPEESVTLAEIQQAILANNAGSQRKAAQAAQQVSPEADALLSPTATWLELYHAWIGQNHARLALGTMMIFQQVIAQLEAFDPTLRIGGLNQTRLAQYTAFLYAQGKEDPTVSNHYWFFRECFQLIGRAVPKSVMRFKIRTGRKLSLQRAEVMALANLVPPVGALAEERDTFLFQLLMLLRDSDLRALRPHHIRPLELNEVGMWPCVALYQEKTNEEVVLPMPPLASLIWERYEGHLPVRDNSNRIKLIKQLGQLAGLDRSFVQVSFSGKTRHEEVQPVWQAMSTHTARHTGAALLVWASEGDQTLKECALGHVSKSSYGYDTLERYGPQLLTAWNKVLGDSLPVLEPVPGANRKKAPGYYAQRRYKVPGLNQKTTL